MRAKAVETKRRGTKPGTRYPYYMDLRICPACAAPATTVFGARRYCDACAASFRAYLDR